MSSAVQSTDRGARETITATAQTLRGLAKPLAGVITVALPHILFCCSKAWAFYKALPKNAVKFWSGFIFCFFGGLYPVAFAAVQAAEHGGRAKVVESLTALAEEATVILEHSKKDDKLDEDKDGVEDVKQIDGTKFAMRKFNLVVTKMNPKKVDAAIATLYRVWLSVVAVLMVQFARTISLALSISDFIKTPVDRFITPTIVMATPTAYERWVPVVLGWAIKSFAMSIAWTIQAVISAVASALTGGKMMAEAFFQFCVKQKWDMGGMIPADPSKSYLDEALMYVFAVLGIYFQFRMHFDMPFPFNLILWPLELFEYYLKWTITKAGGAAGPM